MQETIGSIADQVALAYAEGKPSEAYQYRSVLEQFSSKLSPQDVQKAIVKALFRLIKRRVQSRDRAQLERLINVLRLCMPGNRADKKVARIFGLQSVHAYHNCQNVKAEKLRALAVETLDPEAVESAFMTTGVEHAKLVGKDYAPRRSFVAICGQLA